jgi:hypothetical protein
MPVGLRHRAALLEQRMNGGPAGCAEKLAALRPRPNGRLRMGATKCVPKVSPIVNVPIFKTDQLYVKDGRVFAHPDVSEAASNSSSKPANGKNH